MFINEFELFSLNESDKKNLGKIFSVRPDLSTLGKMNEVTRIPFLNHWVTINKLAEISKKLDK
jgi:hypothetical protein